MKYLWRPRRHVHTSDGYYTHSVRRPLGVCSLLWMVVIIFGHLARDGVTMETTKQWSGQQACYIIVKGDPCREGRTRPPCVGSEPFSSGLVCRSWPLRLHWLSGLTCLFLTVYPATWCLSISFGLWPASVGSLGPGQTHPGVSIETADPGCEFLVLENPMWWL